MNKVISALSRLAICHKAMWKESLLHFNYQQLEKWIATLEENSLQKVSPIKIVILITSFNQKPAGTWGTPAIPLRIQKTSAFRGEQQHNLLHNATTQSLHPPPSAFCHSFQGKKGTLERLETEIMNQSEKKKKCYYAYKTVLTECYPSLRTTASPPDTSTALPCWRD